MGYTYVTAEVANPANLARWESVTCLVDTGALLCLLPRPLLDSLGILEQGKRTFRLADGTSIVRPVGIAAVRVAGQVTGTDVIFGEPADKPLLGVTALEQVGLAPDPATGQLRPLEMLLVGLPASKR